MHFTYSRSYRGPLQLAIFDWAGTTIDYGCLAPAAVFIKGFEQKGVAISMNQARGPMGMEKRAHIEALGRLDEVAAQWQKVHGGPMTPADIDEIYAAFVPLLLESIRDYSQLIPGTLETMRYLRQAGMKIGGTTGYFTEAMEIVKAEAARQGYLPDSSICATQVPAGRPAPWMIYQTMMALDVYPPQAVVKIGDTKPDIDAGLNAGVWTVGLARSGNEVGLSESEVDQLEPAVLQAKLNQAYTTLHSAAAHYVIDGIWDLPPVIDEINTRLKLGDRP